METDYARLALSKVEELEMRLGMEKKKPIGSSRAYFEPRAMMGHSELALGELQASGVVTVLVRAVVEPAGGGDTLLFTLGGLTLAQISFGADEKQCFGFGSARLSGGGALCVRAKEGTQCLVSALEVVLIGEGAWIKRRAIHSADTNGSSVCALVCTDDDIRYKVCGYAQPDFSALDFLCRGHTADVVSTSEGHRIVCCDNYGNMWGVSVGEDGRETARLPLGETAESLSIAAAGDELVVVLLKNKAIYCFTCDLNFKSQSLTEALGEEGVDAVKLVKGSEPLMLVVEKEGVCYLRVAEAEQSAAGEVVLTMDETVYTP